MLPRGAAWTIAVITIVSRSALSTIVALLLWSVLPNLVGFQTTTVMSGSMEPRMMVGDAIVVRHIDASQLAPGQVLLFDDPDHPGRLRMHRLVKVQADGQLVTKGDANEDRDSSTVGFDAVHGAAFLRIPYAGLPNYWLRTGQVAPLAGGSLLVLLLFGGIRLGRLLEDEEERERRRHRGVKLPGMHRAAAAAVALVVLSAGSLVPSAQAEAAYSSATSVTGNTWGTACSELPLITAATPSLYYGYGAGSGSSDIPDLSATGDTGVFRSGASRSACQSGWSSYATFNGTSGVVNTSGNRNHPGAVTIATWFKVAPGDAGGVLADFGNSNAATSSSGVDDALYMGNSGTLTFTASSVQALGLIMGGWKSCTTTAGYADNSWHLVVATLSTASGAAGCAITVDADPSTTVATPFNITISLGAYSGDWRFGYDALPTSSGWANLPTRMFFKGSLDETQIFDSAIMPPTSSVPGVQGAIYARGHGGTIN